MKAFSLRVVLSSIGFILWSQFGFGQSLGQDADGFSTIIVPTATLNLDVENNLASFIYYDNTWKRDVLFKDSKPEGPCFEFNDESKIRECLKRVWSNKQNAYNSSENANYMTFGGDIKGSSKDGLATVVSSGSVSTSAAINGLLGYNWTRQKYNESFARQIVENKKFQSANDSLLKAKTRKLDVEIEKMIANGSMVASLKPYYTIKGKSNSKELLSQINSRIEELLTEGFYQAMYERTKKRYQKELRVAMILAREFDSILVAIKRLEDIKKQKTTNEKTIEAKNDNLKRAKIKLFDAVQHYDLQQASLEGTSELGLSKVENPMDSSGWDKNKKVLDKKINSLEYMLYLMGNGESTTEFIELLKLYKEIKPLVENQEKYNKVQEKLRNRFRNTTKGLIYLRGGFNGDNFRLDLNNDSTTVDTRFQKISFQGNRIELGASIQTRRYHYFGLNFARNYTNNKNEKLESRTFKLQKTDTTITDGAFTSSEEIKALTGPFERYTRYDLSFDYVWLIPLLERLNPSKENLKGSIYLSLNPYIRHRIYENSLSLKNNTVLGLGINTYSTKDNRLMGGLFVQTNDAFGVHAKENSTFFRRINFGVVIKFAIKGFKPEDG